MLRRWIGLRGAALGAGLVVFMGSGWVLDCDAQAPAGAPATALERQIGTVKSIAGSSLVLTTDAGQPIEVAIGEGVRVLQIAPGSTSLKGAETIALTDIQTGDRVLVTGKAGGSAGSLDASRVVLMKSSDIAQRHATEEADWQKRGTGGIVSAVNAGGASLVITEGTKKIVVNTSAKTQFRRYAGDSVKFEDAKPGSFAQIQAGDQLRVRGERTADGATGESINAEEIISGSFRNLAGVIATIDAANQTLTLKDLATKKMVTVKVLGNSSVRALPAQAAARFAARAKGGAGAAESHAAPGQAGGPATENGAAGARSAGTDLSQLVSRLPNQTFADLKVGDAVMIVASQPDPGSLAVTAVTLLSGVEPILAATPSGTKAMALSPWNIGGGAGDSSQ